MSSRGYALLYEVVLSWTYFSKYCEFTNVSPINPVPTPHSSMTMISVCVRVSRSPSFSPKHIITKTTTSFFVSWRGTLYLLFRRCTQALAHSVGRHSEQNCNLKSLCSTHGGPTDGQIVGLSDGHTWQSEFGLRNVHRPQQ